LSIKIKLTHNQQDHFLSIEPLKITTIGRSSKSALKIDDLKLSSVHFQLQLKNNKIEAKDLNSKNGIYLNGIKVDLADLYLGDELKAGSTVVSIIEEELSEGEKNLLTFPTLSDSSLDKKLKIDFTGAREKNKIHGDESSKIIEINIRKKVKSNFKLSKQEISKKHKLRFLVAQTIDGIFLLLMAGIPFALVLLWLIPSYPHFRDVKNIVIICLELLFAGLGFYANKIHARFSIGEKLSGIERKTNRQ